MGFLKKSRHAKKKSVDELIAERNEAPLKYEKMPHNFSGASHALTAEEVLGGSSQYKKPQSIQMSGANSPVSPLDALRRRVENNAGVRNEETVTPEPSKEKETQTAPSLNTKPVTVTPSFTLKAEDKSDDASLLEKCMPFIADGGGIPEQKPAYTLESVDSIINLTEQKFAKLFDELEIDRSKISYDSLSSQNRNSKVSEDVKPETTKIEITEIPMQREEPKVASISDIDADDSLTRTVAFTALPGGQQFEDISSNTRTMSLSSEMFDKEPESNKIENLPELEIDDDFVVEDDYKSPSDVKRVARSLFIKRRSAFIRVFLTCFLTFIMALALIPDLKVALLSTPSAFSITSVVFFAVISLVNFDMFLEIRSLFTPRKKPEALAGITSAALLLYSVVALATGTNPYDLLLTGCIFLCFKAVAMFMRINFVIGNFKIIANRKEKFAIKFIDDKQITFPMARNSIEGDVLVASSLKTTNVQDFIKNTISEKYLLGNVSKFAVAALSVSAVLGILFAIRYASFTDFFEFFAFSLLICFAPSVFFADVLPCRNAGKKLNALGAMITGGTAARKLDFANAVTVTSSQLFPNGTLSLHNIKILDENAIDATLIDAAALATAIDSPLKGIFESIAKTTPVDIPEADTIKYEEKMGISGWIKDRRIFIGNRTLLEAHGISTPSLEVDYKILRQGYFPIYLANSGKPCALLMVKYNVKRDIAYRMQELSASGVTFLIDSCDPNLTDEMVCDYFGLSHESVRVMGSLGCQLNSNETEYQEDFSSVAAYRGSLSALTQIFISANKVKKSIATLTLMHFILASAFLFYFAYSAIVGAVLPLGSLTVLVGGISIFILSVIIYLFGRP